MCTYVSLIYIDVAMQIYGCGDTCAIIHVWSRVLVQAIGESWKKPLNPMVFLNFCDNSMHVFIVHCTCLGMILSCRLDHSSVLFRTQQHPPALTHLHTHLLTHSQRFVKSTSTSATALLCTLCSCCIHCSSSPFPAFLVGLKCLSLSLKFVQAF